MSYYILIKLLKGFTLHPHLSCKQTRFNRIKYMKVIVFLSESNVHQALTYVLCGGLSYFPVWYLHVFHFSLRGTCGYVL